MSVRGAVNVWRFEGPQPIVWLHERTRKKIHRWARASEIAEVGGQLFGHVYDDGVNVRVATKTYRVDLATAFDFQPNRVAEQRAIDRFHTYGLDHLGDWHSHLKTIAHPSAQDMRTLASLATSSAGGVPFYLMLVVAAKSGQTWLGQCNLDGRLRRPLSNHLQSQ